METWSLSQSMSRVSSTHCKPNILLAAKTKGTWATAPSPTLLKEDGRPVLKLEEQSRCWGVSARSSDSVKTRNPMSARRRDVFPTESMSGWS